MELFKSEMLEFLKTQGDKMLLATLIFVMIGVLMHLVHHEHTSAIIPWLEKSVDVVLGSLLTLITGQIFSRKADGK